MSIEVDQSGKVEDTSKSTVLAFSNDKTGAVILMARDKRRLQEMFRRIGAPRLYVDYVFSTLVIVLLRRLSCGKVTIDLEYPGHTKIISSLITTKLNIDIEWKSIGKRSPAHDLAYKAFSKKLKAVRKVSAKDIWKLAQKITGGYLKTGLKPANRYSAPVTNFSIAKRKSKSRTP